MTHCVRLLSIYRDAICAILLAAFGVFLAHLGIPALDYISSLCGAPSIWQIGRAIRLANRFAKKYLATRNYTKFLHRKGGAVPDSIY